MTEARTVRELRLAIREIEQAAERAHMAPAVSLASGVNWYMRRARLSLRQAEIHAAKADDPRLEPLGPLRPQLRKPRARTQPRRKRYRCGICFREELIYDSELAAGAHFEDGRHHHAGAVCSGSFERVARLPKGTR